MTSAILWLCTSTASVFFAYFGPGAGLSAIGAVLALVFAVIVAIFGFVWYPIRRLIKSRRRDEDVEGNVE